MRDLQGQGHQGLQNGSNVRRLNEVNTYIKLPMIRRNQFGDYYKNGASYKRLERDVF